MKDLDEIIKKFPEYPLFKVKERLREYFERDVRLNAEKLKDDFPNLAAALLNLSLTWKQQTLPRIEKLSSKSYSDIILRDTLLQLHAALVHEVLLKDMDREMRFIKEEYRHLLQFQEWHEANVSTHK